jgi:hypothetical protein
VITEKGKDELLAMRLIRDMVPGMSNRYIKYPTDQLVEALTKYSPVRLAGETTQNADKLAGEIEPPDDSTSVG